MQISGNPDLVNDEGAKIVTGCEIHGEPLGLPSSLCDVAQTAMIELALKNEAYRTSSSVLVQKINKDLLKADENAIRSITGSKKVLEMKVGMRWNPIWGESGLLNNSTRIPTTLKGRLTLLGSLAKFFAKYSDWASKEFGATVPILESRAKALQAALEAETDHKRAHKQVVRERKIAAARVRTRLRAIIKEVAIVLAPDDPRWEDFGLQTPDAERAAKPARTHKAAAKAEEAAVRTYGIAKRKAETAKTRAEKIRVRAENLETAASLVRAEADKAAAAAAELLEKANQIAPKGITPAQPASNRNTQPVGEMGSVELLG